MAASHFPASWFAHPASFPASGILPASRFRRGLASRFRFSICPILLHGSSIPPVFRFLPYLSSSIAASHFPASGILPASRFWRSDLSDPAFRCLLSVSGLIWFHGSSNPPASRFLPYLSSSMAASRFPVSWLQNPASFPLSALSSFPAPALSGNWHGGIPLSGILPASRHPGFMVCASSPHPVPFVCFRS